MRRTVRGTKGAMVRGFERSGADVGTEVVPRARARDGADRSAARSAGTRRSASARSRIWIDPRFLVGLLLVVVSIVGVWWLVTSTSRMTPVYAASVTLTPGTALDPADLHVVDTRLGPAEPEYLDAAVPPDEDLVVTRTIDAGELVPIAALGDAASLGTTTLVVQPAGRLSADIVTGSVVDLWAAAPLDDGYSAPEVLVPGAIVVGASEEDGFLDRGGSTSLELAVPRSAVSTVLAATAAGNLLSVVPAEPGAH